MEKPDFNSPEHKLKVDLVKWILEFHKGSGAESKRIRQDLESLYTFITTFVK